MTINCQTSAGNSYLEYRLEYFCPTIQRVSRNKCVITHKRFSNLYVEAQTPSDVEQKFFEIIKNCLQNEPEYKVDLFFDQFSQPYN